MPITAVMRAPFLNEMRLGEMLLKSLEGATTLAARLVVSVATESPTIEMITITGPPMCASSSTGSEIRLPKMNTVAVVTTAPMKANSAIVPGSPTACPMTWSRCDFANREKSGMDSAIVPQNATADVRPAPIQPPPAPALGLADVCGGLVSIGPQLPTRLQAQINSAMPMARRNGEPQGSSKRIDSIPLMTIQTLSAQKLRE